MLDKEVLVNPIEEELGDVRGSEDIRAEEAPYGAKPGIGTKKIKKADLVSMWKYMLSSSYGNKRLTLYTFLNQWLKRGWLSQAVGFQVLNRKVNREVLELVRATYRQISRESFFADVEVILTLQSPTGPRVWNGYIVCECSFTEDGFFLTPVDLMQEIPAEKGEYVRLTPFLAPYLTNRQVDEIADGLWRDYGMREALRNPKTRDAEELARRMGLTVRYLDVYEDRGIDSILFFADAELKVEAGTKGGVKTERIAAGTIVVNTKRVKREYAAFSILHECFHDQRHYLFYRLQDLASNDFRLMKIVETEEEEGKEQKDPLYFMEKQANRGAFALMMPREDTDERIQAAMKDAKGWKNPGELFEAVGRSLSRQLGYPHFRVKARMIQLGYIEAKGALNYIDHRRLIQPFAFSEGSWRESDVTFVIKESTANTLYRTDEKFRAVMDTGEYIFADGHVVKNDPRFTVRVGNLFYLTDQAAERVDDCCLRFNRRFIQRCFEDYVPGMMFYDANYVERTEFFLSDLINSKNLDALDAKMEYRDSFPRSFGGAFDMIMEKNGETREITAERLHISTDTLYRWLKNPEEKITLDFVVRIALMWQIPDWISKMLLDRACIRVSEYDRRHQALEHIRTVLWDQGIEEANKFLASRGMEMLEGYESGESLGKRQRRRS